MKKRICLIIAAVLIIAAIPFAAFAEPDPSNTPAPTTEPTTPPPTTAPPTTAQPTATASPTAEAKTSAPKVTVSTDPTQLGSNGGTVMLTVRVENTAGESNPLKNVSIKVDGANVFSIEQIKNAYNYRGEYSVSSAKVGKEIPVVVTYNFANKDKQTVEKSFTIKKGADAVSLSTMVTPGDTTVKAGDTVSFSFAIENNSTIAIENAKLTAEGINDGAQIGSTFKLSAKGTTGAATVITCEETFTETTVIKPVVTYTAGGKSYTTNLDVMTITVGNAAIDFEITPSVTAVNAGETVDFDVAIMNSGNVDFDTISVYDCNDDPVEIDTESLEMGGIISATHQVTMLATTDVVFTAIATDESGNEYSFTSNSVAIEVAGIGESLLTLDVQADTSKLKSDGKVIFTMTLENRSNQPYTNISITEKEIGEIQAYDSFPNGKKVLTYEVELKKSKEFNFVLKATAPDGSEVNDELDVISITVEESGMSTLTIVLIIVIVLIVAAAAVIIILVLKEKKNKGGKGGNGGNGGNGGARVSRGNAEAAPVRAQRHNSFAERSSGNSYEPETYDSRDFDNSNNFYRNGSRSYVTGTTSQQGYNQQQEAPKKTYESYSIEEDVYANRYESQPAPAEEPVYEAPAYNEPEPQQPAPAVTEERRPAAAPVAEEDDGLQLPPSVKARNVQVQRRKITFDDHSDF